MISRRAARPLGGLWRGAGLVRCGVGLAGAVVLATPLRGAADLWTAACVAVAGVLLVVSTLLVRRWPAGPTAFGVAAVVATAVEPPPSLLWSVLMTIGAGCYLLVVDLAQLRAATLRGGVWRQQLRPIALGTVTGAILAVLSYVSVPAVPWPAVVAAFAAVAAVAIVRLVGHAQQPHRSDHPIP